MWYKLSWAACALLIGLVGVWGAQGWNGYTKDKRQVITKVKDEIFGTETEKIEWVEDFQLGLLPGDDQSIPKAFLSVAVPGSIMAAVAAGGFLMGRRTKRKGT